ncbi:MAG: sugar fermentation stimulation protein [Francisellaceae bacterium]|nr:sugar fermentation stimulation protein [Francisellaceae bacterium]
MIALSTLLIVIRIYKGCNMKFKSQLTEGVFLKRYYGFLTLVALKNYRKLIIRCPQLGLLKGCDILGSKIWFSNPTHLMTEYLHTMELVEVDGGHLVAVNPEYTKILVIEAIKRGVIKELQNYDEIRQDVSFKQNEKIDILLQKGLDQAYIHVVPVTWGNLQGEGLYPNSIQESLEHLHKLISLKQKGNRAVLLFSVQHTGVHYVKSSDSINPEYSKLLREAISIGVEVLAYKAKITLSGMMLDTKIPVLCPEGILPT